MSISIPIPPASPPPPPPPPAYDNFTQTNQVNTDKTNYFGLRNLIRIVSLILLCILIVIGLRKLSLPISDPAAKRIGEIKEVAYLIDDIARAEAVLLVTPGSTGAPRLKLLLLNSTNTSQEPTVLRDGK